jgi:ligand-binding sensor domain-containing protein
LIALCLVAVLTANALGQETKPAKSDPYYMPTAGKTSAIMPKVIMRNMRQDRQGNIWFATFGGPIRYDGKVFTNFAEEVGLANARIFSLLETRSGVLWFGSITGGASRYDGKSFSKFTVKEGLANNNVMWILEDRDANIWLATDNGVSRYDGKTITNFTIKDGLVHNSVYSMVQDASGRIWFGTQGGICSYDGKSFSNFADTVGQSFVNIRATAVDHAGNLWFGGQGGAFRYDGKTLTTFTHKSGMLDDFVGSMIVDRAGNVWLGHPGQARDGGASRYDGKTFKHFTHQDGINSTNVYCMLEDKAGHIWFGTVDQGVSRYDGKGFTNFSAMPVSIVPGDTVTEMSKSIWSVFQDKNNNHWFSSNGQGVYRYDGKTLTQFTTKHGLPDNQIRGIQQHQSGDIFINTTKGVSRYDGQTFTTVKVAEKHPPGTGWKLQPDDLWFTGAQNSGAVYRFDGTSLHQLAFPTTKRGDDHYARLPRDQNPNAKYTPYDVYTIYKDRRGSLWFGTADLGAVRYDGKTFDWLYEDRLSNVAGGGSFGIRSIVEDNEGKFWICNTRHRYNISPKGGNGQINYQQEPGLGNLKAQVGEDSFYFASAITDKQGHLWLTTYNEGVWRYDGKTLTRYPVQADTKQIWIQSIYQDNRGDFWIGTNSAGVYKFNGKGFERFRH